jgi:energy-coupling factor transporter ATP-binding protein EcfA2
MLLSIQETKINAPRYEATLNFDNHTPYHIVVNNPFSEKEEKDLAWYFEDYLQFPFTEQIKSQQAAQSVVAYGETLFNAVFENRKAWADYQKAVQAGKLEIEIVGSPAFQALHWEALKDPERSEPLALHYPIVRKVWGESQPLQVGQASPTLNVLLVVARPHGKMDVGFRTISLPLVQAVQQAKLPVKIEILRPATLPALRSHLEETTARYGKGYYHLVHFDVHGSLLTHEQWQRGMQLGRYTYDAQGTAFAEPMACLFLVGEKVGQAQPVEANRLGELLTYHGIPLMILNACQSAKQQHSDTETSLGSRLSQTGAQAVVAMAYSVTVSAATLFMATLYQKLFDQLPLAVALTLARAELYHQKQRRAYYNQQIALEDWLLPVVYQQAAVKLPLRKFTKKEEKAYYEQQGQQYEPPPTSYAFVGRDVEVLEIENRLLTQGRILLIYGMAGMGKTTLLHHLARWWQATHFVQRVFYFGYDQKLYTQQEVLHELAQQLLSSDQFQRFLAWPRPTQQAKVADELNKNRHLLILDNLEILAAPESDGVKPFPAEEREALQGWLRKLAGGKSVVVLGSRSEENWLAMGTFADNVYALGGLDAEAASQLVDKILQRHHVSHYRQDADFQELLKFLAGYPLAMEVVLEKLTRQSPKEVLDSLDVKGELSFSSRFDNINMVYRKLSPDMKHLLLCLAPFTKIIDANYLPRYWKQLSQQVALADLCFERWEVLLDQLSKHRLVNKSRNYLRFEQYFLESLRNQFSQVDIDRQRAIEKAFTQYYSEVWEELSILIGSEKNEEKELGIAILSLERENFNTALNFTLSTCVSILTPFKTLPLHLNTISQKKQNEFLEGMLQTRLEYCQKLSDLISVIAGQGNEE